jgi:prepilin-type N-terminal cleavage/methylation domain-containing protein/prepilin-type processing-associated H-X9-DG protein
MQATHHYRPSPAQPPSRASAHGLSCAPRRPGFTLVELLVVIGIIAVLIGILLPVLSGVRERSRSLKCQSNLKQVVSALMAYAADHKGSLPYGFAWNRLTSTGFTSDGGATGFITWYSCADRYLGKSKNFDNDPGGSFWRTNRALSEVFRCPSSGPDFVQQVHFYNHPVAMPHLALEWRRTPAGQQRIGPARTTDLYPDNALLWDTPLLSGAVPEVALPFFGPTGLRESSTCIPASFVDETLLRYPEYPELRFRGVGDYTLSGTNPADGVRPEESIEYLTDEDAQSINGIPSYNADLGGDSLIGRQIGNVRFRHNKDTVANVAFADGSVRGLDIGKKRRSPTGGYDTEFRRRMLMIKWPTGLRSSGTFGTP